MPENTEEINLDQPSIEEIVTDLSILANTLYSLLLKKAVFTREEADAEMDLQISELEKFAEFDDLDTLLSEFDEGPEADEPVST